MRKINFLFIMLTFGILKAQNPINPNAESGSKLSATAQLYFDLGNGQNLFFPDAEGRIPALVQMKFEKAALPAGLKVEGIFGNIVSVRCNRNEISKLLAEPNVEYIELSCRLNRVHKLNDTGRILSHVNEVHAGLSNGLNANYKGQGVIVGIVDIGFQPDNPTNMNANGTVFRVKRWWQQGNKSGTQPSGFSYGTEFNNIVNIGTARDDDGTHGTHVAGIAAGSGYTTPSNKYMGMAPESDMVFVSIKYANDTLNGSALGDYIVANPTILDGFKYIFDYAQSLGKPAVINLSWGMHTGPHDGNSLFDKAVEILTGPGKILVGACGNEAANEIHVKTTLNNDTAYTFALDRSRNDYVHENVYCDFWGDSAQTFGLNVSVFDTTGVKKLETPFYFSSGVKAQKVVFGNGTDTVWVTLGANKRFANNGKGEMLLMVETNFAKNQRIRIGMTGKGRIDGWNSGQVYRWTSGSFLSKVKGNDFTGKYLTGLSEGTVGENGGTGKATITAGAYIARNSWLDTTGKYHAQNWLKVGEIANFSSRGPTVDGRIKPDISAPGQNIASSMNYRTFSPWILDQTTYASRFLGNTQFWVLFSGTSMAAPHVAGIVALMLQVNPNLTPAQVKDVLQKTAQRDFYTGKDSNNIYGFGKINAFEAVKLLVNLNVKDPLKRGMKAVVYPNPVSSEMIVSCGIFAGKNGIFQIFDIAGKLVSEQSINFDNTGICSLHASGFLNGIYAWRILCNNNKASGKLVVQH